MAWKKLGTANITTTDETVIYTVPSSPASEAIAAINVVNRGSSEIAVRIGFSDADAPADAEWIEYDFPLKGKLPIERTGLHMQAGQRLVVRIDTGSASVVAWGNERATS